MSPLTQDFSQDFHRKIAVLESLSNKVAGLLAPTQCFPVKFTEF